MMNSKEVASNISIIAAALDDYSCIQNMARFYFYDLSRDCGFISSDWAIPKNGLYEGFDFKNYFEESSRKVYLVKVHDEIAGFVLLNQATEDPDADWNVGEFFIIAKFQGRGVASHVAKEIWRMHPGKWEVSVIPYNKSALKFWEKVISEVVCHSFKKEIKKVSYDEYCPERVIFSFDSQYSISNKINLNFCMRSPLVRDVDAMVLFSKNKRKFYEKAQPQFWRDAGQAGDNAQKTWFTEILDDTNYVIFIAENDAQDVIGFIIGKFMPAPEVYNPGGLTLMIDDFCVASEIMWQSVGAALIDSTKAAAKLKGAVQILVVCGAHDRFKRRFLSEQNLSIASEWFVGGIV
ncbi:MAG: GNAT family N-acetyltransferase [Gammaproteobacteria bacterium]|nr:GNAT family N-acetyltransferase [Gammaproteobacteria bacterium]